MAQVANISQHAPRYRIYRLNTVDRHRVLRFGIRISSNKRSRTIVLPCEKKDIVHHLLSMPGVPSVQRCPELPLELWSHIFKYLPGYPDLARISRLCRSLQHEAELVLYRSVFLHGTLRIRFFHRAIAASPRRAGIVRRLMMDDKFNSYSTTAGMNEILPLVSGVTTLHIKADWSSTYLLDLHLTQLQACTFQLKEFVTTLPVSPAFVRFLERQPHIETLVSISRVDAEASAALPRDVLPALRILNAGREFMNILRHPRNITHVILWVRLDYRDTHAVDKALWVLRHQLVSLKLFRFIHPEVKERIPTYVFRKISAPKLRYLHVWDIMTSPWTPVSANHPVDVADLVRPGVAVETFAWTIQRSQYRGDDNRTSRDEVRAFAKQVLQAWLSLRSFVYTVRDGSYTSCTLAADGELVEQPYAR